MKNISISDEKETIYFYSGKILGESDIYPLERIFGRLLDKIAELERNAPTPERTRVTILEYAQETLLKAQMETEKILDEMKPKVSDMSGREVLNTLSHARMYKEIDELQDFSERTEFELLQEKKAGRTRDKRLSEIEEFMGDL